MADCGASRRPRLVFRNHGDGRLVDRPVWPYRARARREHGEGQKLYLAEVALTPASRPSCNEPDARDFRWDAETVGRSPVSGAAAHVDPEVLQPVQTCGEWLKETDEVIPGPELTAVRVPRDLHVESRRCGGGSGARLMRKENPRAGTGWCAAQGGGRIAALRRIEMWGPDVVDAGEHQQGAIVLQYHVLVLQHCESEPSDLARPRTLA